MTQEVGDSPPDSAFGNVPGNSTNAQGMQRKTTVILKVTRASLGTNQMFQFSVTNFSSVFWVDCCIFFLILQVELCSLVALAVHFSLLC